MDIGLHSDVFTESWNLDKQTKNLALQVQLKDLN